VPKVRYRYVPACQGSPVLLLRRRAFSPHCHYLVHRVCAVPDTFVAGIRQFVGAVCPIRLSRHTPGGGAHPDLAGFWAGRDKIRHEYENRVVNDRRWSGSEYHSPGSNTSEGVSRSGDFFPHRGKSGPTPRIAPNDSRSRPYDRKSHTNASTIQILASRPKNARKGDR